jgi:hypothetical protein
MDNTVQTVGLAENVFFDRMVQPPEEKPERVMSTANDHIDWSILAGALEEELTNKSAATSFVTEASEDLDRDEHEDKPFLQQFSKSEGKSWIPICRLRAMSRTFVS